jgi:hypothetical protein
MACHLATRRQDTQPKHLMFTLLLLCPAGARHRVGQRWGAAWCAQASCSSAAGEPCQAQRFWQPGVALLMLIVSCTCRCWPTVEMRCGHLCVALLSSNAGPAIKLLSCSTAHAYTRLCTLLLRAALQERTCDELELLAQTALEVSAGMGVGWM